VKASVFVFGEMFIWLISRCCPERGISAELTKPLGIAVTLSDTRISLLPQDLV